MYKRFFLLVIMMVLSHHLASAQEENVELSIGISWGMTGGNRSSNVGGLSAKLDLNVDYYFNPKWSLMTGLGIWADGLVMCEDLDGADDDGGSFWSIPLIARYHLHVKDTNQQLVLGLGPALNFTINRGQYYTDGDLSSPLYGREKLNKVGLSLQPIAMYRFNRVGLGVEGNIGLINMQKHYGLNKGSIYFYNVWFKFCYHF